jgi:hypothetical protein
MATRIGDWIVYLRKDSTPHEIVIEVSTHVTFNIFAAFRFTNKSLDEFKKIIDNAVASGQQHWDKQ